MSASDQDRLTAVEGAPPLSLEEARRVRWQVKPYEPMGRMLDEGRLTRKDLTWAIERAYRDDVRHAARRLLIELDSAPVAATAQGIEPVAAPRHGPQVIAASEYLEDLQETSFGLVAFGFGLAFITFFWLVVNLIRQVLTGSSLGVAATVVALLASLGIILPYIRKHGRAWRNARQGRKGEERVLDALRESLDSRWTIYRNLQLPDHKADLDLVLVGPGGVWCVQVKAYNALLRHHNGRWETRRGKGWRPCDPSFDPERAVTRQALKLHAFLGGAGVDRFVERAIALAEGVPAGAVAASPIPVWLPFNIRERAAALSARAPMSEAERAKVNELLKRRVVEQRAVEADRRRKRR